MERSNATVIVSFHVVVVAEFTLHVTSETGYKTSMPKCNGSGLFLWKNIRGRRGGPPPNVYMVGELNKADGKPLLQAIKLVPLSECGSPTLCGRRTALSPYLLFMLHPPLPSSPTFQNSCIKLLFWDGIDFLEAGYHERTCPSP